MDKELLDTASDLATDAGIFGLSSIWDFAIRYAFNLIMVFIVVRVIYYPKHKNKDLWWGCCWGDISNEIRNKKSERKQEKKRNTETQKNNRKNKRVEAPPTTKTHRQTEKANSLIFHEFVRTNFWNMSCLFTPKAHNEGIISEILWVILWIFI